MAAFALNTNSNSWLKSEKHKLASSIKCYGFNFVKNGFETSKVSVWANGSCQILQNPRFYTSKDVDGEKCGKLTRVSLGRRRQAQAALLEYLHSTRSLQFMDADNMSKNSPQFLESFLKKFEGETDIGRSITRFLRYNPINEFEPFYESIGLSPSEYSSFLPRHQFFLDDDKLLLENYYVLCNYGIARNKIGKICKEAMEVFQGDSRILESKLKSFEKVGFDKSTVINIVVSHPNLLMGNVHREFVMVIEKLKHLGIEYGWIEEQLLKGELYNWSHVLELLCSLTKMGCSKAELGQIICQNREIFFECSGRTAHSLIGFMLKFGATSSLIISMFLHFPRSQVGEYVRNIRQCYCFLVETELDVWEIGRIMRTHPLLLGSCYLKKVNSLLACLNIGKSRLREIIIEDPQMLKDWVMGSRVEKLKREKGDTPMKKKTEFLVNIGFVKNSPEMRKALKVFRGKAGELQERFDYLVDVGLDRQDLLKMLKLAPQILNMTKDMLEIKIDFLVSGMGYPVSTLVVFPAYVSYTIQRINLRFSMYNWLVDQGTVYPNLALSTIIACSDGVFLKQYVNCHPNGPEIWDKFQKEIYSD